MNSIVLLFGWILDMSRVSDLSTKENNCADINKYLDAMMPLEPIVVERADDSTNSGTIM
jgi:hypothetical protein